MKRNDFATFLVYVGMFAIALLVGLLAIKPVIDEFGARMPINSYLLVGLGLLAGAVFNAVILELAHLLGAKAGKYRVNQWTVFGIGVKRKEGKLKFGFSSFDGLTGQTKVAPMDVENSSLSAYILFPFLFLLVEFIAGMIIIVNCKSAEATDPAISWLHVFALTFLATAGMVFLYDLFPARIDSINDGFLMFLLNKQANKVAYNNLLLAQEATENGEPIPEVPVYEDVTDFTASLNSLAIYRHLAEGRPDSALPIIELALAEEAHCSAKTKGDMRVLKLCVLLEKLDKSKGKAMYEELDDETKKYIASLSTITCLRAYALIASFIETSEFEANYAIDKAGKLLKGTDDSIRETEKSLLQMDVDSIRKEHPSWDVYLLPWEEKKDEE